MLSEVTEVRTPEPSDQDDAAIRVVLLLCVISRFASPYTIRRTARYPFRAAGKSETVLLLRVPFTATAIVSSGLRSFHRRLHIG